MMSFKWVEWALKFRRETTKQIGFKKIPDSAGNYALKVIFVALSLTHFSPWFSGVFRGYRNVTLD